MDEEEEGEVVVKWAMATMSKVQPPFPNHKKKLLYVYIAMNIILLKKMNLGI